MKASTGSRTRDKNPDKNEYTALAAEHCLMGMYNELNLTTFPCLPTLLTLACSPLVALLPLHNISSIIGIGISLA
jgi:hypothetical protein